MQILKKKKNILIIIFIFNILIAIPETWKIGLELTKKVVKNDFLITKIEKKIEDFDRYQEDSEGLVCGKIIKDKFNLDGNHNFLVAVKNKNDGTWINKYNINHISLGKMKKEWEIMFNYTSQYGLQGIFFSFLYNSLNLNSITLLYFFNILCINLLIIYLLNWIYGEFNAKAMYFSYFNFWIFLMFFFMERNLYWVIWTCFLPICVSIYIIKNKKSYIYLIILPFLSILLKCLNGYEFISTILINMEIPVIYYSIKRKERIMELVKKCSIIGISGTLGFFSAIIFHIKKLLLLTNSFEEALNNFLAPIFYRTNLFGYKLQKLSEKIDEKSFEIFEKSLNISIIDVLKMYLLNKKIIIILILLLIFIIKDLSRKENIPLIVSIVLSFIGVLSWVVLAKGHSYIHMHINLILWNIPFLMLSFAYFGIHFEKYLNNRKKGE